MGLSPHHFTLRIFLAATLLLSCARRGPLLAPEDVIPGSLADLKGNYANDEVTLEWTRPGFPGRTAEALSVRAFRIERACGPGPADFLVLARLDLTSRVRLRFQRRFRFIDHPPKELLPCRYRIICEGPYGHLSEPSNIVKAPND